MLDAAYGITPAGAVGLFHPRRPDCQRHLVYDFGNRPWSSYRRLAHAVRGGEMAVFRISGLSRSHGDLRPALARHRIQPEQRGQAGLEDLVSRPRPQPANPKALIFCCHPAAVRQSHRQLAAADDLARRRLDDPRIADPCWLWRARRQDAGRRNTGQDMSEQPIPSPAA